MDLTPSPLDTFGNLILQVRSAPSEAWSNLNTQIYLSDFTKLEAEEALELFRDQWHIIFPTHEFRIISKDLTS